MNSPTDFGRACLAQTNLWHLVEGALPGHVKAGLIWTGRQYGGCSKTAPIFSCRFFSDNFLMLFWGEVGGGP